VQPSQTGGADRQRKEQKGDTGYDQPTPLVKRPSALHLGLALIAFHCVCNSAQQLR